MRALFHAPLKPPDHPQPSGDREMARLLVRTLTAAGLEVEVPTGFRSYDGSGDPARQHRIAAAGARLAQELIGRLAQRPPEERPSLWFTYHLYHKAPDHLGPAVAAALGIPYVVAEASYAPKQAGGPWAPGHAAAAAPIAAADRVLCLNAGDAQCVRPLLADPARLVPFPPFIDAAPYGRARRRQTTLRSRLRQRLGITDDTPLLLCVAMMRPGDKLASYRVLARALARLGRHRWYLVVAGDGPAAGRVRRALAPLGGRVALLGRMAEARLPALYAASDVFVWPAVREAFGLVFLEAQAAGLPVVAGHTGGVPDIVAHGRGGLLTPVGDDRAFAAAVARLLDAPAGRRAMGAWGAHRVQRAHDLPVAAARLAAVVHGLRKPEQR